MPALLVHMTLAERAAAGAARGAVARVAEAAQGALLLGSVFVDLPYYASLERQLWRQLTGRRYLRAEWGALLHTGGSGGFAAAIQRHVCGLRRAGTARAVIDEAHAFLLGHLCHQAADLACHPAIDETVARARQHDPRPAGLLHTRVERLQSWFFHRDVVGQEIFGAPYARRMLGETCALGIVAPALSPPLLALVRRSCHDAFCRVPTRRELRGWLAGAARYLVALSSPVGWLARPRARGAAREALRRRAYRGPGVDLETPLRHAEARTLAAWGEVEM